MDPRLWQLLNLPTGSVYIHNIQLSHKNSTVILDCYAQTEMAQKDKPFKLIFTHCRDVQWQAVDPNSGSDIVQAVALYLGEKMGNKPAVVYTGSTEMSIIYDDVIVETK